MPHGTSGSPPPGSLGTSEPRRRSRPRVRSNAWLAAPHAAGCGGPGLSPPAETACSLRTVPHTPRLTPEGPRYLHDSAETLAR